MSYVIYCFSFILQDIHVFPEGERTSFPEDTVHMQELRRLHINDEYQQSRYTSPSRLENILYRFIQSLKLDIK